MPNKPSFLIIGLGSIGRRHAKNLAQLGYTQLIAQTRGICPLPNDDLPHIIREQTLDKALTHQPTAAIICNPTFLHIPTALTVAQAGCHIFMEKPIAHNWEGVGALTQIVEEKQLIFQTGFQFRFHPVLQQIKKLLDEGAIGKVISAHVHWGEYLPAWHPWEDYRQSYSAKSELGGGVALTLSHPFDYLRWLLGEVFSVYAIAEHLSSLEFDSEDMVMATLRFQSGAIASVYLDYVERPPRHDFSIIGEKGKINWDFATATAIVYDAIEQTQQTILPPSGFERNVMYMDQIAHFADCIREQKQPICNLNDGIQTLKIVTTLKKASKEGRSYEL